MYSFLLKDRVSIIKSFAKKKQINLHFIIALLSLHSKTILCQNIFHLLSTYGVSTNFRLELIELSASEVFIFLTLVEREERGRVRMEKKRIWLKNCDPQPL